MNLLSPLSFTHHPETFLRNVFNYTNFGKKEKKKKKEAVDSVILFNHNFFPIMYIIELCASWMSFLSLNASPYFSNFVP